MEKYINAGKLKDAIRFEMMNLTKAQQKGCCYALQAVDDAPTADVQEVKHAHWGSCGYGTEFGGDATPKYYICSNCHLINNLYTRYCPWCGAKMDGEKNV